MDDSANKAIMIGAGTLIAIVTISLVINYYSSAKEAVRNIGSGVDIAYNYREDIKNTLLRAKSGNSKEELVKGVDVVNLLNYFYDNKEFKINVALNYDFINGVKYSSPKKFADVNNSEYYESVVKNIILDQEFIITREEITESGLDKLQVNLVAK